MPTPPDTGSSRQTALSDFLDRAVFVFLALFAVALPFSIKGAERAWKIALILWLLKLVADRRRPWQQPLVLPLLAYVTLSAISTALSPDAYLSWDRMKVVCLYLAGIVVAQNIQRLWQARCLVTLLVLSGFAAAVFTAWQYTYGIGVRVVSVPPSSRLERVGILPNATVIAVAGHSVHTPEQLVHEVQELPPHSRVPVKYIPYMIPQSNVVVAAPEDFVASGLGTPALQLARAKPDRAQGTLGHYVVFAEMLTQVGCMAWALLLASDRRNKTWMVLFAIAFAAIGCALLATGTRAAVASLVLGCFVALLLLAERRARILAIAALTVIALSATIWIQHTRQTRWVDPNDISTQFRVLMWGDGLRLIRQHPWFGVGMETVRLHFHEWNIRGFLEYNVVSHFHSTYVQIAVERGIPALLAWLWFCVAYALFLWRLIARLRIQSRLACAAAVGALGGLVAFTFTSFFHYNLGEEPLALIFFFYWGLAVAMDRILTIPGALDPVHLREGTVVIR